MSILTNGFVLMLLWCGVVLVLRQVEGFKKTIYVNGEYVRRYSIGFAIGVFFPLIIWATFRGYFADTTAYIRSFRSMPESFSMIPQYMETITKDKGFYLLSAVIKCIFGTNENIYLLIIAIFQCYFLIRIYRRYSMDYVLTFFLFIASTDYISWIFNGMRQFLAVTIVFGCFELILKRKYIFAIIIILIASQVHGTALIMIPFLFICRGKAWNKKTLLIIVGTLVVVTFVGEFTGVLDTMLQDTQYQNVVSDWQSWSDDGTNPLRVLVYSVPAILSLIGLKIVRVKGNDVINFCINMSIVAAALYVVSIFTSGIFIGRLPIYFSLYSYILLPWEIENLFTENTKKWIYVCLVICYIGFYMYSINGL